MALCRHNYSVDGCGLELLYYHVAWPRVSNDTLAVTNGSYCLSQTQLTVSCLTCSFSTISEPEAESTKQEWLRHLCVTLHTACSCCTSANWGYHVNHALAVGSMLHTYKTILHSQAVLLKVEYQYIWGSSFLLELVAGAIYVTCHWQLFSAAEVAYVMI